MNKKIAKYQILGLNQDDDDSSVAPGWCREIYNAIPTGDGFSKPGGIQNMRGTIIRNNASLASGVNTCIGQHQDKFNNRIFYFIHNSNSNHSIWFFNPNSNTHTKVFQTQYLAFNLSYPITGCDCIEGILTWSDGNSEPRSIVVSDAVSGQYTFTYQDSFDKQAALYKIRPNTPPSATRLANGSIVTNNISGDSFQFCTRYVYKDNTVSPLGPLSRLSPADIYPTFNGSNNYIYLTQNVDPSIANVIKKIQWIYIKNNIEDFSLFTETPATGSSSYSISFYNTESVELLTDTDTSPVDFIANKSKNIVVHEQRLVATMDQYDYADEGNFTFNVSTQSVTPGSGTYQCHLPGTSSTYGIIFFDKYGRTNGVLKKASVSFPKQYSSSFSLSLPNSSIPIRATWNVSGTPPAWAETFSIVMKRNNTVSSYSQIKGDVFFYLREQGDDPVNASTEFVDGGKVYSRSAQPGWVQPIHIKIPENTPLSVNRSSYVRLLNSVGQSKDVEPIIDVVGDKIICGNFGITNWTSLGSLNLYFQIENYEQDNDDFYYETGNSFTSIGSFSTTSGTLNGDAWYFGFNFTYSKTDSGAPLYPSITLSFPGVPYVPYNIISPSPTSSKTTISTVQTKQYKIKIKGKLNGAGALKGAGTGASLGATAGSVIPGIGTAIGGVVGAIGGTVAGALKGRQKKKTISGETEEYEVSNLYTIDYNKIATDFGRPWPEVNNRRINYEPNTLSISDKYVLNSQINGISKFQNLYTLPISRTPIRKLQNVGASNILLAIHERNVTSLASYSGDNILHTSNGTQLVSDGTSIFGYDRELAGGYGTIYPGSVQEYNGKVFFFDAYKGEVVRYGANGNSPIGSTYKMAKFFRNKGSQFVDTSGRDVISGYDPNLNIYFITFRSANPSERITAAFIDREGEERWLCFTSFIPERYASINNRLFSFVNGVMWEHGVSSTYNNFYGVQYSMSVKHPFNSEFSHPKLLRNISTESTTPWSFSSISVSKPNGVDQETSLAKSNFRKYDDNYYADVKRDKNTPVALLPTGRAAIVAGQPLIGKVYEITAENDSDELETLESINYGYQDNPGHRIV